MRLAIIFGDLDIRGFNLKAAFSRYNIHRLKTVDV
jgi:hypothetical protein